MRVFKSKIYLKKNPLDVPTAGCIDNFSNMRTSTLGFKPWCNRVMVFVVFI